MDGAGLKAQGATRVLLVEDEAIIALGRLATLKGIGFDPRHASGIEEAIAALESPDWRPDVVLMDVDLGSGRPDGIDIAVALLERAELPIVFVSSHDEREIVERVERVTSYGYLEKSSSPLAYEVAIKMALRLFNAHRSTRDQEAKYRALAEASPDMIYVIDRDFRVEFVNSKGAAAFATTSEAMIGASILDVFPPALAARHKAAVERVLATGEPLVSEVEERFPTGPRWIDARLRPILDETGRPRAVIGVSTDIGARKAEEARLFESERKYRGIIDNMNDAFYLHDFHCRILDANLAAERMTGYSRDELLSGGLRLLNPSLDDAAVHGRVGKIRADGSLSFDSTHVAKDGRRIPVEVSGKVISRDGDGLVQSFVRDRSERPDRASSTCP
jgi:PAS domain S-box-containing protein